MLLLIQLATQNITQQVWVMPRVIIATPPIVYLCSALLPVAVDTQ